MEVLIHLLSMPFSLQKPLQATIKPTWLQSLPSRILQTTHILEVVIFHNKKSPTINLNKKCNPLLIIYQTNYKIMRINRREIWSRISLTIQLQIRSPHLTVNQWRSPFRKMTKVTILKRGPIMKPSLRGKIMHYFLLMSTHPNPQLFLQNHQNRFQVGQPFDWVSVVQINPKAPPLKLMLTSLNLRPKGRRSKIKKKKWSTSKATPYSLQLSKL